MCVLWFARSPQGRGLIPLDEKDHEGEAWGTLVRREGEA